MCGIAVAIGHDEAEAFVDRMLVGLRHRGDVTDPIATPRSRIAMGTRRLRIVDPENATQPQVSFDGRVLVAFNGEIYNHVELRRELEAEGVTFKTSSDTEVLASSLSFWGSEAIRRFNGMFAFVAVDIPTGEFIAARDRIGVKPLYVIQSNEGFLFCSEIKPLLDVVEEGEVMLLPPGYVLTPTNLFRFSQIYNHPLTGGDTKTLDRVLRSAVHSRVPPDLPVALLFSGGIDSTLVAHYTRELAPAAKAFFLGNTRAPDYRFASIYAEKAGMAMEVVELDNRPDHALSRMKDVISSVEAFDPNIVRDAFCNHVLFERIHEQGFRVALSGEGADELFGGYEPIEIAFSISNETGASVRDQTLSLMHRTNLQRLDRCGMRFRVEAREPFLDLNVLDYAMHLPPSELFSNDSRKQGKAPLRKIWDLYPERLPFEIRDRKKIALNIGCGLDISQKASPWADLAEETVSDRELIDGQKQYESFGINTKEELLYMRILADAMDVSRVPHLKERPHLIFPMPDGVSATISARLSDYVA